MRIATALIVLSLAASLAVAEPTTRPAPAASSDVLVLAFDEIDANPSQEWIGAAVQQSLVAELSQLKSLQTIGGRGRTTEVERALDTARQAGAGYVVLGSYQLVEPQLRITGQVVDVATGRVIGGLKATGTVRDLFALQDSIATQAKRILNQQNEAQSAPAAAQTGQASANPPQVVVNVQAQPQQQQQPADDRLAGAYRGSGLQRAVRRGSVDSYRRSYNNIGYYGSSFQDHWGFPSGVSHGVWPGYLYDRPRYYYPPVVIIRPGSPHGPRPQPIPGSNPPVYHTPRAAGVPLVP